MNPFVLFVVKYVMPALAWILSLFIPGRKSRVAFREANNKAWIMSLVSDIEANFPPKGTYKPLGELVEGCYGLGHFPALWAVEGLGNYYAETFRDRNIPVKGILTDPALAGLPSKSMTMLHAGLGLSFAKRSLEGLSAKSPASDLRKALEKFIGLCRDSSRPGYTGCAYESLGLVSIILHNPQMTRALDRLLAEMEPRVQEYMWRGGGRALYFHPRNFIPGWHHPWPGIPMIREIAPHETARRNLRAGIAWATTVVNMRNPEIMEGVLLYQGEKDPDRDLFVNGVVSSIIMRYDTSPDGPYIWPFINHQPDPANALLCKLWQRDIQEPCEHAIRVIHPALHKHGRLEEVFRYQDLTELVRTLG